ncbi:MAG: PQQ-dependent sugar dehydrogenase [Chloroflexota bacterium]|nr:PQQ-dependent sugar dehydrogenase [Chloroflexota bacterium]
MRRFGLLVSLLLLAMLVLQPTHLYAQILPPCADRDYYTAHIWIDGRDFCLEFLIGNEGGAGELAYTALAVGDAGEVYAARPLVGQIIVFEDSNGDALPDIPRILLGGLVLPNALAWYDGALYVAGGSYLYRVRDGIIETLSDTVPIGMFWITALAVDATGIYVGVSADCTVCMDAATLAGRGSGVSLPNELEQATARGAILRYPLSGGQPDVWATGLHQPGDLVFYQDALWVSDSTPAHHEAVADLDEINRVIQGADFGFPMCIGATVDMTGAFCITQAALPAYSLPTRSTPLGMAAYRGDALPRLQDTLLVVLAGNRNNPDLQGYQVVALRFNGQGQFVSEYALMPNGDDWADATGERFSHEQMSYRNSGFFPRRPLDVAVSAQGWVYISVQGGQILVVRPQ